MTNKNKKTNNLTRRVFLRQSALVALALPVGLGSDNLAWGKASKAVRNKKVIVIGYDGMDPKLTTEMIQAGDMPNFAKLDQQGGFKPLGTSTPPQSPVAWASFINGAGPGSHGIFDFIHRNPRQQGAPVFSAAETVAAKGGWETGKHNIPLSFWPFKDKEAKTLLKRQGTPFWDYLDQAGIKSVFYDLPSNYPPSPSKHGNHSCLSGMGVPDLLGNYGGYHHFSEDGPVRTVDDGGCKRSMLFFENEHASAQLIGPSNIFLKKPAPVTIDFAVHRNIKADATFIEIQDHKIILKKGQWSEWLKLDFVLSMPDFLPDKTVSGICRFYLQDVSPNFRLYVTPVNTDPSDSALQMSEPPEFLNEIADELGPFYTTGFQEDYKALANKIFTDEEYVQQAGYVLDERIHLLNYALDHYKEGLLFFYFSSTDLQSHMCWWDTDEKHPYRSAGQARKMFDHLKVIYRKMDDVLGEIMQRFGDEAVIIAMSDHGFTNFRRQFNLNSWLRDNGYLITSGDSVLDHTDWSQSRAYGMGINGLYINLQGRERDGIVKAGPEYQKLLDEIIHKLESVTDTNGQRVINKVFRSDATYSGPATALAPDLIIGYNRGYRASWITCLGNMSDEVLSDNDNAWSADHCADPSVVPGILCCNRPIKKASPSLVDLAPTILTEYGLSIPSTMKGKDIFA